MDMQTIASIRETGSRQIETSFRQLIDSSSDAILVHLENQIVFANAKALQLFGAKLFEQLIGHSFFHFLHPDTRILVKARLESARRDKEISDRFKHQIIGLDGSLVQVATTMGTVLWNGQNAVQICLREVKLQTEFEVRLRESETKFHQLADAMPQIVWMAGADGKIDYRNKKFFEQTGLSEEEADTDDIWNLILHPDDATNASSKWKHSVTTGQPFEMEYRYKIIDRGYRWHLGRALPIRDADGKVIRWFGTCTDVHDQKMVEIVLQETKEQLAKSALELERLVKERTNELQETVRSAEQLNYSIAHDLRAPLRAMMGFSTALLEEYAPVLDETAQEYAGRIAASAARMDNLIGSLLAYGRLNYVELSFGFINLPSLIGGLLRHLEPEIAMKGARIRLVKPMPDVWANDQVLQRIFIELIENSLKFHKPNEVPEIEIGAEDDETKSSIWIRDNGIGIPPEHHERIFRVLESLHVSQEYPGTGIGLAIVRRGVERLGGRIELKSAPDQGSCFRIELPKALI